MSNQEYFESLIPDYLNDALDEPTRQQFEQELLSNAALQAQVEEERTWQNTMREAKPAQPSMSFESFEPRIAKRTFWPIAPIAAGAFAVLVVAFWIAPNINTTPDAPFETLTDPAPSYAHDVVRIMVYPNADLAAVIADYNLTVLRNYPSALAFDISAEDLDANELEALRSDARVKFMQQVKAQD